MSSNRAIATRPLDDIIIYSDTLSEKKLKFLCDEVKILGRVVDDNGIRMDPEKVDRVLHWKTPTNRDQCRGFIGSVGYLLGGTTPSNEPSRRLNNMRPPVRLTAVYPWSMAQTRLPSTS